MRAAVGTFVRRRAEEMYTLQREESSACLREKSKGCVGERLAGQCLAVSSVGLLSLSGQCLVEDRNHGVELERDRTRTGRAVSGSVFGWWRGVDYCVRRRGRAVFGTFWRTGGHLYRADCERCHGGCVVEAAVNGQCW